MMTDGSLLTGYDLSRLNLLVVDDNKYMILLIKTLLHSIRVKNVREASDGAEAFMELRKFPADMVVCDLQMQPLDGIEFTRLVRTAKDSPNQYVPIIMLTGHTEERFVKEARDAGVNEFLSKPLSAAGLYSRIIEIIDNPRPFVRTPTYFGPDRRRKQVPFRGADRRKAAQADGADEGGLTPDEIEDLMKS